MENLTWYSFEELNEPMNLLIEATKKIKFVDEFYDTISIFGDSPTQLKANPQGDNDIIADSESNYFTNNLTESIFTPWKSEAPKFEENTKEHKKYSLAKDREIHPDSILNWEVEVSLHFHWSNLNKQFRAKRIFQSLRSSRIMKTKGSKSRHHLNSINQMVELAHRIHSNNSSEKLNLK